MVYGNKMLNLLWLFSLLLLSNIANATIVGGPIDIQSVHGSCLNVTVGAGPECTIQDQPSLLDDVVDVDVSADAIVFDMRAVLGTYNWTTAPSTFDIVISGLNPFSIVSTVFTDFVSYTGSVSAIVSNPGELTFTYSNYDSNACGGPQLCARLTVNAAATSVPAPASLALLLAGLGLAFVKRSRA